MKIYYFQDYILGSFTAGSKAVMDVNAIMKHDGVVIRRVWRTLPYNFRFLGPLKDLVSYVVNRLQYAWLSLTTAQRSAIVLQHPLQTPHSYMKDGEGLKMLLRLKGRKQCRMVALIHDICELREGRLDSHTGGVAIETIMNLSDVIITHNDKMIDWFVEQGVVRSRLVSLDMFDYLTDNTPRSDIDSLDALRLPVSYVGTLRADFCGFLRELKKIASVQWELWGPSYDEKSIAAPNVHYNGCCNAEELPSQLKHGLGLVWYGSNVNDCGGALADYIKLINPHKLSCFLVSGLPVLVWKQAAVAEFVIKNDIGYAIDSLEEIPAILAQITKDRYETMRANVLQIATRLRAGYYFSNALRESVARIEQIYG